MAEYTLESVARVYQVYSAVVRENPITPEGVRRYKEARDAWVETLCYLKSLDVAEDDDD